MERFTVRKPRLFRNCADTYTVEKRGIVVKEFSGYTFFFTWKFIKRFSAFMVKALAWHEATKKLEGKKVRNK